MFPRPLPWSSLLHRVVPAAWIAMTMALLLLVAAVVVLIGSTGDPSVPGMPAHELLGPFRWTPLSARGLA